MTGRKQCTLLITRSTIGSIIPLTHFPPFFLLNVFEIQHEAFRVYGLGSQSALVHASAALPCPTLPASARTTTPHLRGGLGAPGMLMSCGGRSFLTGTKMWVGRRGGLPGTLRWGRKIIGRGWGMPCGAWGSGGASPGALCGWNLTCRELGEAELAESPACTDCVMGMPGPLTPAPPAAATCAACALPEGAAVATAGCTAAPAVACCTTDPELAATAALDCPGQAAGPGPVVAAAALA